MAFAETDWERHRPHRRVPLEVLRPLTAAWGVPKKATAFPAGKANTNLKVELVSGQVLVLRLHERDRSSIERERRLMERVRGLVPVPDLLGQDALTDGTPVSILSFVEGSHPADLLEQQPDLAEPIGAALGDTLGRLHAGSPLDELGLYAPDLSLERRFDSVADSFTDLIEWSLRVGRARKRLSPQQTDTLRRALPNLAEQLRGLDRACLTHGDFKSPNLLLTSGPEGVAVSGVLDWEFASAFTPLLDIAILLRHRHDLPDPWISAFARSYTHHAELPDRWEAQIQILDLMNLIGFLNARGDRPRLYDDVRAAIFSTVEIGV